jgi:hypothetical protein
MLYTHMPTDIRETLKGTHVLCVYMCAHVFVCAYLYMCRFVCVCECLRECVRKFPCGTVVDATHTKRRIV